jgi:putative DNA primase/helicase
MDAQAILDRFQDVTEQPDGGYLAVCPGHNDSKPSLRVWFDDAGRCRITCRAGCDSGKVVRAAGMTWRDMFRVTGTPSLVSSQRPEMVGADRIDQLRRYLRQSADALPGSSAQEYALRRFGVTAADAVRLGLGFVPANATGPDFLSAGFRRFPRLLVPLIGFDGVVRGAQGRDLSGDCPARWMSLSNPEGMRWASYGVFHSDPVVISETVVVTEGPGDALTAVGAGHDALLIRGASLANSPELLAEVAAGLADYRCVVVAGDNDRAGRDFTSKLTSGLAAHGVRAVPLIPPTEGDDLTDWRARNVADFPDILNRAVDDALALPEAELDAEPAPTASAVPLARNDGHAPTQDQIDRIKDLYYETLKEYGQSDVQSAYLLARFAEGQIKYASGLGFFTWSGKVWEAGDKKVRNMLHFIGRALKAAADDASADWTPDMKKGPEKQDDPGEGLRKAAKGFTTRRRIDDCMSEITAVPAVVVEPTDFDQRPDLLSFANGTVDLRTGVMHAHRPEDLLTYCLAVDYDPEAKCGRWEQFLEEIFPGMPEMPAYMQRLTGVGVTGHTSEQCFAVFWGKGANGKSVLMDTLTTVFRAVTTTTPFSTFEEKASGGIPNDIAALRGARFVMASEGEASRPMSEALLKRVTGKDEITARFLRKEYFTFKPSFLLMLATNFKPKFRGQDEGLWRRVKLVPFTRFFKPEEQDHTLDATLAAEAEGIAAWAVRGAMEWYKGGLQDPDRIRSATLEYRRTQDALAGFFPGVLETCPDKCELSAGDAYQAYKAWCEAEGLPQREQWTRRTFLDAMEERSVARKNTAKGVALVGIRIHQDHADAPAGPGIFA